MKNILRNSSSGFTKWSVALIAAGWVGVAQGQSLYESFSYTVPGNVGGLSTATSDATGNNNWATHSNSTGNSGAISLVSGSLSFPGLATSGGNRINIPGNNTLVPRDINRATGVTGTPSVAYFSFLLNVINNTQLTTTGDYFIMFGNQSGAANTTLFGRVSIKSVNTAANFRLGISNTTGGTPTYTDVPTDLVFGQTYLVVVKYDFNGTANDIATIWVNPTLGATEPTGGTSNNSGTATSATTFASIALRNGSGTPNADIDEIRFGTTWASVASSAVVVPTVTTSSSVSAISSTGATVGGSISNTGGANATETGIFYSTTSGFANGAGTKVSTTGLNQGTGAFTQIVTGLSQNTTYYFKAFAANSAGSGYGAEQSFTTAAVAQVPPSVTAAPSATVDANIEMTFTDNPSYRAAITDIKVGGASLPAGAFSTASAGKIVLSPSASSLLQSSGSKIITITATGYEPLNVTQAISHGAATKLGILTEAFAPAANGAAFATQPVVAVQDQYGNTVLTSTETVTAAVGTGGWILGGVAGVPAVNGVVTFSGLTAGKVGTLTGGTISFTSGSLTGATSAGFNLPLPVFTVSTSNSYNEGVSGQIGTVSIPFAAPADITVTLASSSVADFKVDGNGNGYVGSTTVVIASGTSSSEFFLDVPADSTVDSNVAVTLTASATDFTNGTKAITVVNVDYDAPTIVINKVLNDSPVDTVELLVVGNGTPGSTVNLQGIILKDYSSNGANDNGGSYTFATSGTWASVKAGTLIVLSNQPTGTEDLDGADFLIRANLQNTALFTAAGTFNIGTTELVQIKASGSTVAGTGGAIHSFAYGSTGAAQIVAAPLPKLVAGAGGNLQVASNSNGTLADFNGSGITLLTVAPTTGIPHSGGNAAFIDSLRGVQSLAVAIAAESAILDETAAQQLNAVTLSLSSPAASNLTVNLSASPTGAISLPASIVIPSGSTSAQVSFTPINDAVIAGNRTVTITATASGYDPGSNQFTLVDVQFANPSIVINEVVNGGTGGADSVELLVTQNKLNAVGMIFKDFSGNMGGDGGRAFTFTNAPLWQSLPAGTLIVLSTDTTMVEDTDASDFLVKIQLGNTTYFTGSGGSSLDISNTDMVMIKAAGSGTTGISGAIHTFGSGTAGNNFKLANGAKLLFAAGGAGGGADNATSAIVDYNGTGVTGGTATLGAANNANNQTFVTALRASSNSAPTGITLSAAIIPENSAVDTVVGAFSTTDADSSDTFTYSLVPGTGDTDNALFNINGTSLRASVAFDFETKSSYSVRVRTRDSANNTFEKVFSITVTDVVEGSTYSSWLGTGTPSDAAFLDYVFGAVTPGTLDPSLKPSVAITGGNLVLTYYVRQGTVGLTVTPKTSADLAAVPSGWVTTDVTVAVVGPRSVNGVNVEQRTASVPVSGAKKFLRVEAVQQ